MTKNRRILKQTGVILIFLSGMIPVSAQYTLGMTGLLNTPNAEMQTDGLFMAGGNFLPQAMSPDSWDYHTGNYFLNMTFLPFVEMAYRCTLLKGAFKAGNKWQQDRSVSIRLRPLKERRLLPSVVVGSNDVFTTNQLNALKDVGGNRYFASVYAVATKNIDVEGHGCSLTFGSYIFSKNDLYKGVFGGIRYTPVFLKPVSLLAEYDGNAINAGLTARVFRHFSVHLLAYDFKTISCGLRYEFHLLKKGL